MESSVFLPLEPPSLPDSRSGYCNSLAKTAGQALCDGSPMNDRQYLRRSPLLHVPFMVPIHKSVDGKARATCRSSTVRLENVGLMRRFSNRLISHRPIQPNPMK